MLDTAGTICNAAEALVRVGGAKEIYACATHAVLSSNACEKLSNSVIKDVVILDTIEVPEEKMIKKFTVLTTASVFAETIERIYENLPVSTMFENK